MLRKENLPLGLSGLAVKSSSPSANRREYNSPVIVSGLMLRGACSSDSRMREKGSPFTVRKVSSLTPVWLVVVLVLVVVVVVVAA